MWNRIYSYWNFKGFNSLLNCFNSKLRILIFGLVFLFSNHAKAGIEPEIKQVIPRPGVAFAINNTATVFDAVLLNSSGSPTGFPPSQYSLFKTTNKVFLDIDQSLINHFVVTQFTATVEVEARKMISTVNWNFHQCWFQKPV